MQAKLASEAKDPSQILYIHSYQVPGKAVTPLKVAFLVSLYIVITDRVFSRVNIISWAVSLPESLGVYTVQTEVACRAVGSPAVKISSCGRYDVSEVSGMGQSREKP